MNKQARRLRAETIAEIELLRRANGSMSKLAATRLSRALRALDACGWRPREVARLATGDEWRAGSWWRSTRRGLVASVLGWEAAFRMGVGYWRRSGPWVGILALLLLSTTARALDCLDTTPRDPDCLTRTIGLLSGDLVRCEGREKACGIRLTACEADATRLEAALLIESDACRRRLEDVVDLASKRELRAVAEGRASWWRGLGWGVGGGVLATIVTWFLTGVR